MNDKCWPNLIIPGAGRSGKMALCEYLGTHKDIFLPNPLEPNFFAYKNLNTDYQSTDSLFYDRIIKSEKHYNELFLGGEKKKIRLDASGSYLFFAEKTISEISSSIPEYRTIKIIIMLRNPIERALSAYTHYVMHSFENLSPDIAISVEMINERLQNHWSPNYDYISGSMYSENVKRYIDAFDDVKIILSEDLKDHTQQTLKDIYKYLNITSENTAEIISSINTSGIPKNKNAHDILYNSSNIVRRSIRPFIRTILSDRKRIKLKNYLRSKNLSKTNN